MCEVILKYQDGDEQRTLNLDIPIRPMIGECLHIFDYCSQHPDGRLDQWFRVLNITHEINVTVFENPEHYQAITVHALKLPAPELP